MQQQIQALQQIFGLLFGGVAKNAQHSVKSAQRAVGALSSINPLHAQDAYAPQHPSTSDPYARFDVNGHPVPAPSWGIRLPPQNPTVPMPQMLGFPDWTASMPLDYSHPRIPIDSQLPRRGQGQFISPGQPTPRWTSEQDGGPIRYPRFKA